MSCIPFKQISLSFTDLLKAEYFHSRSVPAYFNLPNDYDRKKSRCVSVFNVSRKVPVNSYGWFGNFLFHSDYHRCVYYICVTLPWMQFARLLCCIHLLGCRRFLLCIGVTTLVILVYLRKTGTISNLQAVISRVPTPDLEKSPTPVLPC